MTWSYYETVEDVVDELNNMAEYEERWGDGELAGYYRDLARKVAEFHETFFEGTADLCLGYVLVRKPHGVKVKALILDAEAQELSTAVEIIDVEEWLRSRDDP
jgi:hypothetical protein